MTTVKKKKFLWLLQVYVLQNLTNQMTVFVTTTNKVKSQTIYVSTTNPKTFHQRPAEANLGKVWASEVLKALRTYERTQLASYPGVKRGLLPVVYTYMFCTQMYSVCETSLPCAQPNLIHGIPDLFNAHEKRGGARWLMSCDLFTCNLNVGTMSWNGVIHKHDLKPAGEL